MVAKKVSSTKKPVTKKQTASRKKSKKPELIGPSPHYTSFKVNRDIKFFNMRVTKQTIYWSILLIFILLVQIWILNTQLDVLQALDTISK
jgi:hypothetical protein